MLNVYKLRSMVLVEGMSPLSLFRFCYYYAACSLNDGLKMSNKVTVKSIMMLLALSLISTFSTVANAERNYCGRHNPLDSDADEDFKKCGYIGAGYLFATHVDPDGESNTWKTSDDSDSGYNIYLGWHFKPRWFAELSYADLGEAELLTAPPNVPDSGGITYKIPSLHVGYWFLKPEERFNVYAKAGLSSISNNATNSAIPFEKQNRVNITGGVGVQWRSQASGLFARLEAVLYDKDAYSLGINVGYYFGSPSFWNTSVSLMDNDGDGVRDENDLCPKSMIGMIVDVSGCGMPDISLHGVSFRTNSAVITRQSKLILDNAAAALMSAPFMRVEVQAHTDSLGKSAYNEGLSARRAMAVKSYLESKGVSSDRMEARGYGETQPIATNKTRVGRQQNRRVELVIIK